MGRVGAVALAGGLVAVAAVGFASPAAAANIFTSQWADSTWNNSGSGQTNSVRIAPGKDDHNGATTEYLNTTITGTFCVAGNSGFKLQTNIAPLTEQATDLAGVTLNTTAAKPTATVARTVTLPAGSTVTKTPTKGKLCETNRGTPATTSTLTINGSWSMPRGTTIVTYSGTDCGGTGTCKYINAAATGSIVVTGTTFTLGGTSPAGSKWMWNGNWDLDATCSPVAGYPCQ